MISAYDHGFLYGMGLFETFRTFDGKPFLLREHLTRLMDGCVALGIRHMAHNDIVEEQVRELLEANDLQDAYVRYTVSAGSEALGLTSAAYNEPNVVIYMKPLPNIDHKLYEQGKLLQRLTVVRNSPEGAVRFKSLHYMNNMLAFRELSLYRWLQGKQAEGLMLNGNGHLAEGITSNVFWVNKGMLMTPAVDTGILPGITRQWIVDLANTGGMMGLKNTVQEGYFTWNELIQADEAFVTNSIQGIVPVCGAYDEKGSLTLIGKGIPGEYTTRLMQQYRKVASDR